jgi:hypothetical protein
MVNESRTFYVDLDTTRQAINMAPDSQWRLIMALCRYGGLRCPSEVLALKWAHVDFEGNRLTIPHCKTRKRVMPILPELRPDLEDCFDPEQVRVIHKYRQSNVNLRKGFREILENAEIQPWERLFHNLRGSLQTDLINQGHPAHGVSRWVGSSRQIMEQHYLRVTGADFDKAARGGLQGGPNLHPTTGNGQKPASGIPVIPGNCDIPRVSEDIEYTWVDTFRTTIASNPGQIGELIKLSESLGLAS